MHRCLESLTGVKSRESLLADCDRATTELTESETKQLALVSRHVGEDHCGPSDSAPFPNFHRGEAVVSPYIDLSRPLVLLSHGVKLETTEKMRLDSVTN